MISTSNFTYDKNLQKMYAEASDLEGFAPTKQIQLKSHRTGQILNFVKKTTKFDHSHEDIVSWEYVPVKPIPALSRIVIFND